MPITYREFRDLYRGMGAEEVGRQKVNEYDFAFVSKKEPIVIPFSFPSHPILLSSGDETILEDEEIESHLRLLTKYWVSRVVHTIARLLLRR